jgi:hypothetical protein
MACGMMLLSRFTTIFYRDKVLFMSAPLLRTADTDFPIRPNACPRSVSQPEL